MRRSLALLGLGVALLAGPAAAQGVMTEPQDVATAVATATAGLARLSDLPQPATATPMAEAASGSVGTTTGRYALANHSHPRITFSPVVFTAAGGTFAVAFPAGFFATPPTVLLDWVNTGTGFMACELTASPTVAGCAGRCRAFSLTGLLTLGAGIEVHVLALPRS